MTHHIIPYEVLLRAHPNRRLSLVDEVDELPVARATHRVCVDDGTVRSVAGGYWPVWLPGHIRPHKGADPVRADDDVSGDSVAVRQYYFWLAVDGRASRRDGAYGAVG